MEEPVFQWSRNVPLEPAAGKRLIIADAAIQFAYAGVMAIRIDGKQASEQSEVRDLTVRAGRLTFGRFRLTKAAAPGTGAAGPLNDKIEEKLSKVSGGIAGSLVSSILRPMLDAAFGKAVEANTQISYDRPALYGGGTQSAHGGYRLACNLTPETLEQVGMDAWNALSSKF